MGTNTKISWTHILGAGTGSSWNPFRARLKDGSAGGWACVKVSEGCKFCYAETMNKLKIHGLGTGLPYDVASLQKIEMLMSTTGQTSIDWPLRVRKSHGIFPCDMTDWLGDAFIPVIWSNQLLAVMMLAQQHIFLTLTKRWERLEKMLTYFTEKSMGLEVGEGKVFDLALVKAIGNSQKWQGGLQKLELRNAKYSVHSPWPAPNIFFGISICTQKEAERAQPVLARIKQLNPAFKLWISYEPALEVVDWESLAYDKIGLEQIVVGGESGKGARRMSYTCVEKTIEFGKNFNVPIYVKQTGSVLAQELGLTDSKGQDVPEEWNIRQFPDVSKAYIQWK